MNILPAPESVALAGARRVIDHVDDAFVLLLAARRWIVGAVVPIKHRSGERARNPDRETQVRERARRLARRLGVPDASARQLVEILIRDACLLQGLTPDLDQGADSAQAGMIAAGMTTTWETDRTAAHPWLRLLPPPQRARAVLRFIPRRWQARAFESMLSRALAPLRGGDTLTFMHGRRLGIEVTDLDMHWTLELRAGRLHACEAPAEATVRGTLTDLLLLASRLEDADTLFFQRRLQLTGDTELGLTVRNVLDRLPWEQIPLGLRIALNRAARFARAARAAHRCTAE
ncbi:MAG: SCP2 sterol-binding domain-containing protein [Xanthomonadaceae bacterium]|nr:SCP2 sterol-binding domain-containing protein [Xanthomonadaceae bacterium]MDE2083417.1 SCP2 sterol-binding domain-containing protein [Xanthomonadaceae bacterium]